MISFNINIHDFTTVNGKGNFYSNHFSFDVYDENYERAMAKALPIFEMYPESRIALTYVTSRDETLIGHLATWYGRRDAKGKFSHWEKL